MSKEISAQKTSSKTPTLLEQMYVSQQLQIPHSTVKLGTRELERHESNCWNYEENRKEKNIRKKGDWLGDKSQNIIDFFGSLYSGITTIKNSIAQNIPSFTLGTVVGATTIQESRMEIINRLNDKIEKGSFFLSVDNTKNNDLSTYYFNIVESFLTFAQTSEPDFKLAKDCLDKQPKIIITHPKYSKGTLSDLNKKQGMKITSGQATYFPDENTLVIKGNSPSSIKNICLLIRDFKKEDYIQKTSPEETIPNSIKFKDNVGKFTSTYNQELNKGKKTLQYRM